MLRRFGLGASEQELEFYGSSGLKGAIDKLLSYDQIPDDSLLDREAFATQKNGNFKPDQACGWWTQVLTRTKRPLQERMVVFWHNHFATSTVKVNSGYLIADQNEIFRKNATGKFSTLLSEVSKDPAMLYWLDNHLNVAGKPNENFAREVMELFTLGVGNYTEKDVQEAARAFTGWTYQKPKKQKKNPDDIPKKTRFVFETDDHDGGTKSVLGKSGRLNGDDVLELLCAQPQTARFITGKVWEWFVYDSPDSALIERHASVFHNSGLDIAVLLRSIMESEEFYSARAYRKLVKNPLDITVVTARQLGLGAVPLPEDGKPSPAFNAIRLANNRMGMELMAPPDVSGWKPGTTWITSATMIERVKWADRIFAGRGAGVQFASLLDSAEPRAAVAKLLSIFDAEFPATKIDILVDSATKASGGAVTAKNANAVATAVCRIIFGAPEFQVC
ncbi:MAG: DUF1800 domain-containing protein [Fimbriimonadaceae bacterium]